MIKFLASLKKFIDILPAITELVNKILEEISKFDLKKVK